MFRVKSYILGDGKSRSPVHDVNAGLLCLVCEIEEPNRTVASKADCGPRAEFDPTDVGKGNSKGILDEREGFCEREEELLLRGEEI